MIRARKDEGRRRGEGHALRMMVDATVSGQRKGRRQNVIDIWKVGGCLYHHNLRKQNGYYMQHVSTNCRKFTIRYTGPMFWNIVLQPVVHCAIVPTTAATMLLLFSKVEIIEASCVVVD